MPAQKRPPPPDPSSSPSPAADADVDADAPPPPAPAPPSPRQEAEVEPPPPAADQPQETPQDKDASDEEGGSESSPGEAGADEFILVKLCDIRKEVQCPICLGIIRKTRTVMECLHRFCRECIDKSMRLGNNECPACRTHCASRRSLRDDPNYDALIAALYPDIDKYEEEELAFHEEEKNRNKKIQASIAETFRRQSEALGRKRSARKSQRTNHGQHSYFRGRGRMSRDSTLAGSDDEEEDANGNDASKDSSSADERTPDVRQKRMRRWAPPRSSPARAATNADAGCEDNDDTEVTRENLSTSPLRVGNREMLAWGKNGARSQTRHGNASGSYGRLAKSGRMTKMVECLRNLDETDDDELDIYLTLLPLHEESMPQLAQSNLCCRPTLSIKQLCQFIALQTSVQPDDIEIFVRKPEGRALATDASSSDSKAILSASEKLKALKAHDSLEQFHALFLSNQENLVLVYQFKAQS